jgi:hypothetical protein
MMTSGKSSLGLGRYIASDGQKDADENAASIPLRISKSAIDAVDGSSTGT